MGAPYVPSAIANEFLERAAKAGKTLTPMQLLKLVYMAHGWSLALTENPLINECVQAWKYGPVVPSLFHEFKSFGGGTINRLSEYVDYLEESNSIEIVVKKPFIDEGDVPSKTLIDWVWQKYGSYTGKALSAMTHLDGSPWKVTYKPGEGENHTNIVIQNEVIKAYYKKLWAERNAV